jgi:N-acyl-D-amino-acid deacylase
VRDVKLLTLEDAVRKMTSLPADFVGLRDRGRVQEGLAADLAIFDPHDGGRLTWDQPRLWRWEYRTSVNERHGTKSRGRRRGGTCGQFINDLGSSDLAND